MFLTPKATGTVHQKPALRNQARLIITSSHWLFFNNKIKNQKAMVGISVEEKSARRNC